MKKIVHTKSAPEPIGPYSQAVVVSGAVVYSAGQIPLDPATGEIDGADISTQTHRAISNLGNILEAAGSSFDRVVKTTVFLKDLSDFAAMNAVYAEYFGVSKPARSTVEVSRLPKDAMVEIEAIAIADAG